MKGWETEHGKCIANILRKYPNAAYLGKYSFPLQGSLSNAPTILKLYSWSPGAGFICIISTKGINQIKKGKL